MRRTVVRLLSCCALLAVPAVATAQGGTVRGRVTDSAGVAVPLAVVSLSPGTWRARTDPAGRYSITRVTRGRYTLTVRRVGLSAPPVVIDVDDDEVVERDVVMGRVPVSLAGVDVVIGSRVRHTAEDELAVPVDVFTADQIRAQGTTETAQILAQLAPSVNFPRQSVSDATEIVRPFTMRGLSPDHTLVLLNGKRRHHTALTHYYGAGQGAGSSGVDMNAFPASAIDRLEVLRDGAAAQYGSDAIAGVVNVVVRSGAFAPFLTFDAGEYMTGEENLAALPSGGERPSYGRDGRTIDVNGGWGGELGRATFGLFAEYRDREPTNRAGPDPSDMFSSGDADEVTDGGLTAKNNAIPQPNHHWGDGASKDLMTFGNLNVPFGVTGQASLYAFGGWSRREGTGFGYFRAPSSERNWTEIYPNGFLPRFAPDVVDVSAATGVRGAVGGWAYDLGGTLGHNGFEYRLENTLNTSLGPCLDTPCAPGRDGVLGTADDPGIPNKRSFRAGELRFTEAIVNLDASHEYAVGLSSPLNVAVGAAYRRERYQILAGEPGSYVNGFHKASDSSIAPSGSQVFPGFRPADEADADRDNVGAYLDLEGDIVPKLLANVAARWEHYSDFGNNLSGKLAARLQPSPRLTLRATVSTGFRAPSLNQSYYSSVVTNFKDDGTGTPIPFDIGIFPVGSPEARALGARPLKAEKSRHFTAGFAVSPIPNFTFTGDFYLINLDDRVVLTGFLDTDSVASILRGIDSRAEAAQYFTNAIDTRTRGVDVTAAWQSVAAGGTMNLDVAVNWTRTTIPNESSIPLPPELEGTGEELVGRYDEGGLLAMTEERPEWRGTATAQYARGALNGLVRYSHYGKYTSALYSYSEEGVQEYGAKGLVDAEIGWRPIAGFKVSLGARNLFDVYPDRMSAANGFDIFPYPPASPFGYNGRFVYTRLELSGR